MFALEYYVKTYGHEQAIELLSAKSQTEVNADLKIFYSNCLNRIDEYVRIHNIEKSKEKVIL